MSNLTQKYENLNLKTFYQKFEHNHPQLIDNEILYRASNSGYVTQFIQSAKKLIETLKLPLQVIPATGNTFIVKEIAAC